MLNAPLSARVDKILILDWNRVNCSAEMTYDTATNNCVCLKKHYDAGSACLGCLDYCDTCGDSLTCIDADGNRDTTGIFDCLFWKLINFIQRWFMLLYGLYL